MKIYDLVRKKVLRNHVKNNFLFLQEMEQGGGKRKLFGSLYNVTWERAILIYVPLLLPSPIAFLFFLSLFLSC